MIYFIIYFLDYTQNYQIKPLANYKTKEESQFQFESIILNYIKELQGQQQADICKQYNKTPEIILSDTNLKEGNYLVKSDEKIHLYEKKIK